MEVATCITALLGVMVVPFSFLVAPFAFCLWFLSMDLGPLVTGLGHYNWSRRMTISMLVGELLTRISESY